MESRSERHGVVLAGPRTSALLILAWEVFELVSSTSRGHMVQPAGHPSSATPSYPKDKFQALLESAGDAIISISPVGIVINFNPAAERLFRSPAGEFLGRNIACIMPDPHREEHDGYLQRYLSTGERRIIGTNREVEARRPDGTVFPAELAVTEVHFADEHFFTCIIRDITERTVRKKQLIESNQWLDAARRELSQKADELRLLAEQAVVLREAADAASRAKSEFLTNTSHELRTPLTAIMGFAEIIIDESQQDEVKDFARTVLQNGRHLLKIVNDILDFAAIEAGSSDIQEEPFSPEEAVAEVVRSLTPQAAQWNVTLNFLIGPEVPDLIVSDPRRFRQILLNLVANGVKFSPGGTVVVRMLAETTAEQPMLSIEVIDTGIGMSPEQLPKLFKAFSLVDASLTRAHGGAGLGLAISHRLCSLLGGRLTVSSELGRGSTFSFTIPLQAVATPAADLRRTGLPLPETPVELVGRRILVVDDSPDNVRLLKRFVGRAGATTDVAVNGEEAVAAVATALSSHRPYDAILLDLQMPVMNGYDAARWIRDLGYEGPVIAVTAEAEEAAVRRSLDAGCDDLLTKPVQRRDLLDLLTRRLQEAGRLGAGRHSSDMRE